MPLVVIELLFVRGEGQLPDALADQQIVGHLPGLAIDHGDAVRRAERDEDRLPSLVTRTPTGCIASFGTPGTSKLILWTISCSTGSITLTVPPISALT